MRLFDRKFSNNKARYVAQSALATMSMFVVLLLLDARSHGVIAASLGASFFVAFTMPEAQVSRPRFMIGGYVAGLCAGTLCHFLSVSPLTAWAPTLAEHSIPVFGALAVGIAIFAMVLTDTEHPPAAGVALGLVLSGFDLRTVGVLLGGIVSLCVIKGILRPMLRNLL